ncbi:hypothetical protein KFE25_009180 [Diacronema lutheri]|uniref:Uncharacterized protein n=1 Tax=Diacronema lutheri TaxID=2081491 RepID=A0A8J5XUC9_DIALT|nr:hypothetical protein KFE25_009180 [Diacronema lutheri]
MADDGWAQGSATVREPPPASTPAARRNDPSRALRPKAFDVQVGAQGRGPHAIELEQEAHGHRLSSSATATGAWPDQWTRVAKAAGPLVRPPTVQLAGDPEQRAPFWLPTAKLSGDTKPRPEFGASVPHEVLEPLSQLVTALGTPAKELLVASALQLARRDLAVPDGYALGFIVRHASDLRALSVAHNPALTADGAWPIAHAIAFCPRLTALNLSHTSLLRRAVLPGDGNPHGLDAQRNRLDARAVALLSSSLRKTAVVELAVEGNAMRQRELHLLAAAWASVIGADPPLQLRTLRLGHNELGDPGAIELARSLARVGSLRVLDVRANRIGDGGAAALARVLDTAPRLLVLCARANQIGARGTAALAPSLALAHWLARLDLGQNPLGVGGDEGVRALCETLGAGGAVRLEELCLDGSGLGARHKQRLQAAHDTREALPAHPTLGRRMPLHILTVASEK